MYDIIIVGAGPAGLTAAIYARRNEKKVLVIDKIGYGGQIINTFDIENYPVEKHISGFDLATKIYNQAKDLGTEFKTEIVEKIEDSKSIKKVITNKGTYEGKAIIIATGAENRKLNIENEDKLIGKGISYCATCDGNFFKDKVVAVLGGGNTAIDDALYLSSIAKKVYLIHRRDFFRGEIAVLNKLKEKDNVEFILKASVIKLNFDEKLTSIEIKDNNDRRTTLNISGLFIAIGRVPKTLNFSNIINLDNQGYIVAEEDCHTNISGVFVAGDARTKNVRQIVTATSDGAVAATEAIKYLNNN